MTVIAAFLGPLVSLGTGAWIFWRQTLKQKGHGSSLDDARSLPPNPQRLDQPSLINTTHLWTHRIALMLMIGTIMLNVIPFNYRALGPSSLIISLLTALGSTLLLKYAATARRTAAPSGPTKRFPLLLISLSGLLIHSLADGAALYSFGDGAQAFWAPAILLDRIAVGFFVWTLTLEQPLPADLEPFRSAMAWGSVASLCGATILGYGLMQYVIQIFADPQFLGIVQSLLVGVLVPLMAEKNPHPVIPKSQPLPQLV